MLFFFFIVSIQMLNFLFVHAFFPILFISLPLYSCSSLNFPRMIILNSLSNCSKIFISLGRVFGALLLSFIEVMLTWRFVILDFPYLLIWIVWFLYQTSQVYFGRDLINRQLGLGFWANLSKSQLPKDSTTRHIQKPNCIFTKSLFDLYLQMF